MHSIRTKVTLLTVCAIIIAMTIPTVFGILAITSISKSNSDQMLLLLCETGEKNLDFYFESVEQSVEMVSTFVQGDLEGLETEQLQAHMDRARDIFRKMAYKTNGVCTYYYRVDPTVSETVKGFWYISTKTQDFVEHEVTDIAQYDMEDTSKLVWFTVPRATGRSIWLPPYVTENLNVRVISYNVPIYFDGTFVGVVGIEIDYSVMAEQVDSIKLYDTGYAFINDAQGNIIYHPNIDVIDLDKNEIPQAPSGLVSSDTFFRYRYNGEERQGVWLPLSNGMRLNVTVSVAEMNGNWQRLLYESMAVFAFLLVVFILLTMRLTGHITRPLRRLTDFAEQVNSGNYEIQSDYRGNDEIGILSSTFDQLISHLKVHIDNLNNLAYVDALTSVRNKGAFNAFVREMETNFGKPDTPLQFAVGVFDCDGLKSINDQYGHDKGDVYLRNASALICKVFQHSPVFRTGGDEFTVILQNEDYQRRDELVSTFEKSSAEISSLTNVRWEQTRVAVGVAVYDPQTDRSIDDVVRRADKMMYENKRLHKIAYKEEKR